ncbi:MAG TPA: type II toxin-antitoxin system prevent-host-death family antitoxin [Candidatus Binataceae bacterium]|nr:type II toxin-antitoxin system prevent-host-death family antitoxin [Candidatus Binataceae bacterium]
MKRNARQVGLFDAKTHLSALIDRVEQGEEIVITKRGAVVARLMPAAQQRHRDPREAVKRIRSLRRELSLKGASMRELIEAGRL